MAIVENTDIMVSASPVDDFTKNCILGNCIDRDVMPDSYVDLTITSPPYNIGMGYNSTDDGASYQEYLAWTEKWLTNLFHWTKSTGRLCLNIPLDKNKGGQKPVGADITTIARKVGWQYHSTIIWNESNISKRTAWGSWLSASAPYVIAPVELIVILYKDSWKKNYAGKNDIVKEEFMAWTNGLWSFNGESAKRIGHPAPFPKELPYRCIKLFSYLDDMVFDPFLGSGTTMVMAAQLQRKFSGIEIDPAYYDLAKKRFYNSQAMI